MFTIALRGGGGRGGGLASLYLADFVSTVDARGPSFHVLEAGSWGETASPFLAHPVNPVYIRTPYGG